jgi:hypothetical protein
VAEETADQNGGPQTEVPVDAPQVQLPQADVAQLHQLIGQLTAERAQALQFAEEIRRAAAAQIAELEEMLTPAARKKWRRSQERKVAALMAQRQG